MLPFHVTWGVYYLWTKHHCYWKVGVVVLVCVLCHQVCAVRLLNRLCVCSLASEIYPFVVVVIGLENILIIVRAVISSDPGLDVKFRVAEGLSREGMALTKNLCTELFLLAMGIICFNYAMKVSLKNFFVVEKFP